jgi:hypothetical protein
LKWALTIFLVSLSTQIWDTIEADAESPAKSKAVLVRLKKEEEGRGAGLRRWGWLDEEIVKE